MGTDLDRYFSRGDIKMTNKFMKKMFKIFSHLARVWRNQNPHTLLVEM